MPLSDRDYMQPQRPRPRPRRVRGQGLELNPVYVIIALNLLMYLVTWASGVITISYGSVEDVVYKVHWYLGMVPEYFYERPWSIVTSMFLHAGPWQPGAISHIFGNMLVLYFFGRFLAMLVGNKRFLLVYFVGGIVANLFVLFLSGPLSITYGASGAVFAVAAALAVMMPNLRVNLYFVFPMPLWVVVIVFFGLFSFMPGLGISWQAHIGGLLAGAIAGYLLKRRGKFYYIVR